MFHRSTPGQGSAKVGPCGLDDHTPQLRVASFSNRAALNPIAAGAVRYALNQWEALTRFLKDGDLEIDNGATERANRDIAIGRGKLDVLRQRRRRQNGRYLDELHRNVQAEYGRAIRLVPGCAVAHSDTLHQPNRRATPAQLEGPRTGRHSSLKSIENHIARRGTRADDEPLTNNPTA
jgi:hypothetical protein